MKPTARYVWQQPGWPALRFDGQAVADAVAGARRAQGFMEGQLAALGLKQRQQLSSESWTQEALSTAAIEGESLELHAVRSSVARRLGIGEQDQAKTPRHVDGLLDIMEDALALASEPLTHKRIKAWQAALFPTGYSGMTQISVGQYRKHAEPMQIVSDQYGRRERVHYQAPPSDSMQAEMAQFIEWFNGSAKHDNLVKAAIAHLWLETVHPFEDGNGRVGRNVIDLTLARDMGETSRIVRISQRLLDQRGAYYRELEKAQHSSLDVTEWIVWFILQVQAGCELASKSIDNALAKARFWSAHQDKQITARQRKALNVLLDAGPNGFEGGMSTKKYENLTGVARATASRDLIELAAMGLLQVKGDGRGTRYYLPPPVIR